MELSSTSVSASGRNAAVQRCLEAARKAYENARAKNQKESDSAQAAKEAYVAAMPHLSGADNIRDFIACIAYAMIADFIFEPTAVKLLYAAQVALAGEKRESARKKDPASAPPAQPKTANSEAPGAAPSQASTAA